MNFREQTIFFFTTFHSGFVNILFHIFSVPVYGYGFIEQNILFVLLGTATEEIGHLYNHFFKFRGKLREKSLDIVPYQIVAIIVFIYVVGWLSGWFN